VLEAGLCTRFQEDDEDSLATHPQRRLRPEVIVIRRETKVRHVQDRKSAGALVDAAIPSRRDSDTHAVSGDTYRATAGLGSGRSYQQEHRHAEKPLHNRNTVNTRKESCLVRTQRTDSRAEWRSCRVGLRRRTGFGTALLVRVADLRLEHRGESLIHLFGGMNDSRATTVPSARNPSASTAPVASSRCSFEAAQRT
jgi:hypothetical protein